MSPPPAQRTEARGISPREPGETSGRVLSPGEAGETHSVDALGQSMDLDSARACATRALTHASNLVLLGTQTDILPPHDSVTGRLLERVAAYARGAKDTDPEGACICEQVHQRLSACRPMARCKRRQCPWCARGKAIQLRRRLETQLAALRPGADLVLATMTLVAANLDDGVCMLTSALRRLRRRRVWRTAVAGGYLRIELQPCRSDQRLWLPHAHALLEISPGAAMDPEKLDAAWGELLAQSGSRGSSDLQPAAPRWVAGSAGPFCPTAFYLTKHVRSEWLAYEPAALATLLRSLTRRRCYEILGTWRQRTPRGRTPR
jgi:hypothetical protein